WRLPPGSVLLWAPALSELWNECLRAARLVFRFLASTGPCAKLDGDAGFARSPGLTSASPAPSQSAVADGFPQVYRKEVRSAPATLGPGAPGINGRPRTSSNPALGRANSSTVWAPASQRERSHPRSSAPWRRGSIVPAGCAIHSQWLGSSPPSLRLEAGSWPAWPATAEEEVGSSR